MDPAQRQGAFGGDPQQRALASARRFAHHVGAHAPVALQGRRQRRRVVGHTLLAPGAIGDIHPAFRDVEADKKRLGEGRRGARGRARRPTRAPAGHRKID
jgi:hypothetical protein